MQQLVLRLFLFTTGMPIQLIHTMQNIWDIQKQLSLL
nr:MAG TPA: hypothetical protein [Caudoviricetes sp.]